MRGGTFSALPWALALLLSLSSLPCHLSAPTCEAYSGSFCTQVFPDDAHVDTSKLSFPILLTESLMLNVFGVLNLTMFATRVDPVCADAAVKYGCSQAFSVCSDDKNSSMPMCMSTCQYFAEACGDLLIAQNRSVPQCNGLPASGCLQFDRLLAPPQDFSCPDPLIRRPENITSESCVGECCIPCPQTHYFYPEGHVSSIDQAVFFVAIISLFGSIATVLSYSLMPEKRSYPSTIILYLGIAFVIIYFPVFFLVGNPNRVRCVNEVEQSLPGHHQNRICQFQSTLLIYGFLSAVFWFFLLVLNIYVSVIFLSKRLQDFRRYYHIGGWGVPWIFVIAAHATHSTGYAFGISCVTDTGAALLGLLLIPIACLIFPAVALNAHVLYKIFTVAKRRNASIQAILRLQIRSFLFVTTLLIVFLFYWLFIEYNVSPLKIDSSAPFIKQWVVCIVAGGGQNGCASVAEGSVPALVPFALAEILVYSLGIVIFVFFCLKMEVFYFWKEVLTGNTRRIMHKGTTVFETQATVRSTGKPVEDDEKKSRSKRGEDEDEEKTQGSVAELEKEREAYDATPNKSNIELIPPATPTAPADE